MKILLAVCSMIERSGVEWFVYDLAIALNALGHSVIIYAPVMDDMVNPLRYRSIACVTDPRLIAAAPDIIIGNTQAETMLCLAQFPDIPVISICHDRSASHGRPPIFSRIRRYVAVDANCAERLILENGITESQIKIIKNGVDLTRFKPRLPLPKKPKHAVIFSNYATDSSETQIIRSVCSDLGIKLTVIGRGTNNLTTTPENLLGQFDLVFAKARCAMEAMVVGCAVVLINESMGMAGMVTPANMVDWHAWNFGRKLLQHPIESERIKQAIQEYSPKKVAEVSAYLRQYGSLETTVTAFLSLIQAIIAEEPLLARIDPKKEQKEFASYLHESRVFIEQNLNYTNSLDRLIHQQQHRLELQRLELEQQRQQLEQQHEQLTLQEQMLAEKEHYMQAKLQLIHNSSSWRLTAPLRKIKTLCSSKWFMLT